MMPPDTPGNQARATPAYALGHSAQELDRLARQARLSNPITLRFLRDAGISRPSPHSLRASVLIKPRSSERRFQR